MKNFLKYTYFYVLHKENLFIVIIGFSKKCSAIDPKIQLGRSVGLRAREA